MKKRYWIQGCTCIALITALLIAALLGKEPEHTALYAMLLVSGCIFSIVIGRAHNIGE